MIRLPIVHTLDDEHIALWRELIECAAMIACLIILMVAL